jgi:hypothetical protein
MTGGARDRLQRFQRPVEALAVLGLTCEPCGALGRHLLQPGKGGVLGSDRASCPDPLPRATDSAL